MDQRDDGCKGDECVRGENFLKMIDLSVTRWPEADAVWQLAGGGEGEGKTEREEA